MSEADLNLCEWSRFQCDPKSHVVDNFRAGR